MWARRAIQETIRLVFLKVKMDLYGVALYNVMVCTAHPTQYAGREGFLPAQGAVFAHPLGGTPTPVIYTKSWEDRHSCLSFPCMAIISISAGQEFPACQ